MGRIVGLAVLLLLAAGISPALAQSPPDDGWVLLKTEQLNARGGDHRIEIANAQERTHAIRLVATNGRLLLRRVVVGYANGQQHFEERAQRLARGERSQPIGQRDESLVVQTIALTYDRQTAVQSVTVQVWGQTVPASEDAQLPSGKTARPHARSNTKERYKRSPVTANTTGFREVGILFGTSRKREADRQKGSRTLATFSGAEGGSLILGRAVVTVPFEREIGSIPRPEIDFVIGRIALRGEDPRRDFTIAAVDVVSREEFLKAGGGLAGGAKAFARQAFVFIHGYNVGFDDAIFRTAQIAHDLGFDGPAVTFSWPSRGGTWDYRYDVDTSNAAQDHLLALLKLAAAIPGVESVNIVAHSMGNAPLLALLGKEGDIRRAGGQAANLKLNELLLAAPDVSRTSFAQLAEKFRGLVKGGVTLYASANDRAILASKRVASGLDRAGDVPQNLGPLIVYGVETIDVSDAATGFFGTNHSTFAERQHLVEDIRVLFARSLRPPHARFPIFRAMGAEPKKFWRYFRN